MSRNSRSEVGVSEQGCGGSYMDVKCEYAISGLSEQ